jgi:hypothetical protein
MRQRKNFRISITIDKKVVVKDFYTNAEALEWKLKTIESKLDFTPIENEIFNPIIGFSMYMASNYGRIISLNYKRSGAKKLICPSESKDGYLQSMFLDDNGKYITKKVHRLVALAFYGLPKKDQEVNHKDGNKKNNNSDNLEYITHSENVKHAFDNGLAKGLAGIKNGNSKLTDDQVRYIREQKKYGGVHWGREKIANELGISSAHVKDIANSKTLWKHILV